MDVKAVMISMDKASPAWAGTSCLSCESLFIFIFDICCMAQSDSRRLWNLNSALNHFQWCYQYFLKRKILPSVVRREMWVCRAHQNPVWGQDVGHWEGIYIPREWSACIFLENLCLQGVQSPFTLCLTNFLNRMCCSLTHGKKSWIASE